MHRTAPCSSRFFRVLLLGFSERLMIPKAFAKHMPKQKCITGAILVNPNGKAWHVDIHKDKQSMCFEGAGWIQLIHAHNLELGYFLVFSYKGNMVFNFKAYDLSTCEIAYPAAVGSKTKIEERSHNKVIKEEDLNPTSGTQQFVVTATRYNLSSQYLYVPVKFMRGCNELAQKRELILKDPKGQSWPVHLLYSKVSVRHGSGMRIGNGWLQFARGNKLKIGDKCVFRLENGEENGEENVMQVQILRK